MLSYCIGNTIRRLGNLSAGFSWLPKTTKVEHE